MNLRWTAAVVAAGCLAAVSAGCSRAAGPGHVPGKPARSAAAYVVTYQGYSGTAIVSADGRTVTVGRFVAPCSGTARAVARETATLVELRLRETVNLITWRENGLTDLIMVASPRWHQMLTTTQLVAIADSA